MIVEKYICWGKDYKRSCGKGANTGPFEKKKLGAQVLSACFRRSYKAALQPQKTSAKRIKRQAQNPDNKSRAGYPGQLSKGLRIRPAKEGKFVPRLESCGVYLAR